MGIGRSRPRFEAAGSRTFGADRGAGADARCTPELRERLDGLDASVERAGDDALQLKGGELVDEPVMSKAALKVLLNVVLIVLDWSKPWTFMETLQRWVKVLETAIKQVAIMRGRLGAFEKNTLETNVNSLNVVHQRLNNHFDGFFHVAFASKDVATEILTRWQLGPLLLL